MRAPAFQFYAADYLADEQVQLMTLEEEGIYIRLLAYCWREGSIPADPAQLSRLCKGVEASALARPLSCFILNKRDGSRLVHVRLEQERKKQKSFRESRVSAGTAGGRKRAAQFVEAKKRGDHTQAEWQEMRRFFGHCVNCHATQRICKDHITPIAQGGSNSIANLQPLCAACVAAKGTDRTDYRVKWCSRHDRQMPGKWLARDTESARQKEAHPASSPSPSFSSSSSLNRSTPAAEALFPKSADEVKALAARFPVTSTVREKPDDGFCEWWYEEQEKCGWTDPRNGRAWHDWKAAFNAAWRARTHNAQRHRSRAGPPPARSRISQPQYRADDTEL